MKDRDDDWQQNFFQPGTGFVNQNTPGLLLSATMTRVVRPTIVNEMNFGYTHNRWGFKAADDFDYQSLYRSTLGIDPPRFEPLWRVHGSAGALGLWWHRRWTSGRIHHDSRPAAAIVQASRVT